MFSIHQSFIDKALAFEISVTFINIPIKTTLIILSTITLIVLYIIIDIKIENKSKLYPVKKPITKSMIETYIKKRKKKIFNPLTLENYYEILGVSKEDHLDYIDVAYKLDIEKYELKNLDIINYHGKLKEEALKNLALIEYSYEQIKQQQK